MTVLADAPLVRKMIAAFLEFNRAADRVAVVKRLYSIALQSDLSEDGRVRSQNLLNDLDHEMEVAASAAQGMIARAQEMMRPCRHRHEPWPEGDVLLSRMQSAIVRTRNRAAYGIVCSESNAPLVSSVASAFGVGCHIESARRDAA